MYNDMLYEPVLNPTYQDMAQHYGIAVIPTRVRSPQDKAKVENAVLQVERQILAKLRDHTFFSLHELNQALRRLLNDLNQRPFQKLGGCRQSQFLELEKPALKPLPITPYTFAQWKKARAGADYHIALEGNYYSVPFFLLKKSLMYATAHALSRFSIKVNALHHIPGGIKKITTQP